jgi:hypothetical protein
LVTYVVHNQSDQIVRIDSISLVPGNDARVTLREGSCMVGLRIPPNARCTLDVQIAPLFAGAVDQVLRIQHTGFGPPLWADIALSITESVTRKKGGSYLVDETRMMDRKRRLREQEGHRRLARVHAREHPEQLPEASPGLDEGLQNSILQNPWLNSQRFDGIDVNINPNPPLNSEARREFDNERREQEMEKQLRLGLMPSPSRAPKPHGP